MAIYISKKALDKVPDLNPEEKYLLAQPRKLKSTIFNTSSFYLNLSGHTNGAYFLNEGTVGTEVTILKIALRSLNKALNINDPVIEQIDFTTGLDREKFDSKVTKTLERIQEENDLEVTGYLNQETLFFLDDELSKINVKNKNDGTVYNQDGHINNASKHTVYENENGIITFDTANGNNGTTKAKSLYGEQFDEINDYFIANLENPDDYNPETDSFVKFIRKENVLVFEVPPKPEPNAKLHKIKKGETLAEIIRTYYYEDEYKVFTSELLFPDREMKPDTRLRFMVNLLYYFNSPDREYNGMNRQGFARYDFDHLDDVNIFNNDSYELNYKVFVEKLAKINPSYGWNFDDQMNPPITLNEGEYIWLPSRTFAESTFYHLNFRPKVGEMYQEKEDDNGLSFLDWSFDIEDFKRDVYNTLIALDDYVEETVNDVVRVYEEAFKFFTDGFKWVIEAMEDYWPRGGGGSIFSSAGITLPVYGVPLAADVSKDNYMWRSFTRADELTFNTFTNNTAAAGLDVGIEAGITATVGLGKGKRNKAKFGIGGGAGADLKISVEGLFEHIYPVTKNNTALISMMISYLDKLGAAGAIVAKTTDVLKYIRVINLDPAEYLVKTRITTAIKGNAWGQSYIGYVGEEDGQWAVEKETEIGKTNFNWFSLDNIWWLIKRLGLNTNRELGIGLGFDVEYNATYDHMPMLYNFDGRIPDTVEIKTSFFVEANANLSSGTTSLFNNFNMIAPLLGIRKVDYARLFFNGFNFQKGVAIQLGISYKRKEKGYLHRFNNNYFPVKDVLISNDYEEIQKSISAKIFTGDVDLKGTNASEIEFMINLDELLLLIEAESLPDTIASLLKLFDQVKYRKRSKNVEYNRRNDRNKTLTGEMNKRVQKRFKKDKANVVTEDVPNATTTSATKFLKEGLKASFFTDVEILFKFETFIHVISFAFKYIRLVGSRANFNGNMREFDALMAAYDQKVGSLIDQVVALAAQGVTETQCDIEDLFNQMAVELDQFIEERDITDQLISIPEILPKFIEALDIDGMLAQTSELMKINYDSIVDNYLKKAYGNIRTILLHLAEAFELSLSIGAEINANTAFEIKLGVIEKIRLAFAGGIGIYFQIDVFDKGKPTAILDPDDEYVEDFIKLIRYTGGVLADATSLVLLPYPVSSYYAIKNLMLNQRLKNPGK